VFDSLYFVDLVVIDLVLFLVHNTMVAQYILLSCVCMSVCLSLTKKVKLQHYDKIHRHVHNWNCIRTARPRIMQTAPHNCSGTVVF